MARTYTSYASRRSATPQSQSIPSREQEMTPNNVGGVTFKLDDWERLHRFLILGSELGTYYVGEQTLTEQNAAAVIRCIKADGLRVVQEAYEINISNRAPKVDQQLFVMALVLKHGDINAKRSAEELIQGMLRTGTHVLHFTGMLANLMGWSRVKRRIIAKWFEDRSSDDLAYQVLKYQSRDGWSMRDLLRVAHPAETTPMHKAAYRWVLGKEASLLTAPSLLVSYNEMQALPATPTHRALFGIANGLPREALPTEALATPEVWRALLPQTPPHALLRNLGVLSERGILVNGSPDTTAAMAKLTDHAALVKARVHPFAVLLAMLVYKQGRGVRSGKSWPVIPAVIAALEDAYDAAFQTVEPTNKRLLIGVDISHSMTHACIGTPIPASSAAAAMAITLARLEPHAMVVQFDDAVQRIVPVTKRSGIASVASVDGGGTDVGAPVRWALGEVMSSACSPYRTTQLTPHRQEFDAFVILTDNETWAGREHTSELLARYRRTVNPNTKLVCCSMAANHANIVDPDDPLSLGAAGLDANLPAIVSEFLSWP